MLGNSGNFLSSAFFFFKKFMNTSLNPDQVGQNVGPDLGINYKLFGNVQTVCYELKVKEQSSMGTISA